MTYQELRSSVKTPIFSRIDVIKLFHKEPVGQINTQLYRMIRRGDLVGLKRGLYIFVDSKIDEFVLANKLYTPSYVSLESALNVSGVTPDVPAIVTSVTTVTSKKLSTSLGMFVYSKVNKVLFFGYKSFLDPQSSLYYNMAVPEKALLDYIYIRKIKNLAEFRVDLANVDREVLVSYSVHFPKWVRKVIESV